MHGHGINIGICLCIQFLFVTTIISSTHSIKKINALFALLLRSLSVVSSSLNFDLEV